MGRAVGPSSVLRVTLVAMFMLAAGPLSLRPARALAQSAPPMLIANVVGRFYPNPRDSGSFDPTVLSAGSSFVQAFPTISFNPLHGAYDALDRRASAIGRALRTADNPAVRSAAGRLLRSAGELSRFANAPLFRIGGPVLAIAGFGIDVASSLSRGRGPVEAGVRAGLKAGGGLLGATLGAAACVTETVATSGFGIVACPVLVVGFGAGGGLVGSKIRRGLVRT